MSVDEPKTEEVAIIDEEAKRLAEDEKKRQALIEQGFPGGINAQDQAHIDAVGDQIVKLREAATGWDTTAVPTYGQRRVPESMKENAPADWREIPVHQVEILPEYGEEHDDLVRLRTDLEGMKCAINSLGPICEIRLRCATKLKELGTDLSEEGAANLTQDQVMILAQDEEAQGKRDIIFENLRKGIQNTKDDTTRTRLTPVIEEIVTRGKVDFQTKDQYVEYWGFLQSQTRKIFAEQKKLLERIKVIKRDVQAKLGTAPTKPQGPGSMDGFSSRGGGLQNGPGALDAFSSRGVSVIQN